MLRRLLFAALLAVCFDVAVPLEPSVHGGLVWENDEEQAVRADERRAPAGATQRAALPRRDAAITRARLAARARRPRAARRRLVRLVRVSAAPPHPSPTEEH
jgi:hypothetical protein